MGASHLKNIWNMYSMKDFGVVRNAFMHWKIHEDHKMKLNAQEVWQIYWYSCIISDHFISTPNV